MTSRMVLLCLPLLLAALSPCLVEGAWEDWNTGSGGVKWLLNCNFPGYDIGNRPSAGEDCGRLCMEYHNCNHFSHFDGICYMKNVPIEVLRSPANVQTIQNPFICGHYGTYYLSKSVFEFVFKESTPIIQSEGSLKCTAYFCEIPPVVFEKGGKMYNHKSL
ncbi:hypothetical protein OUZ56_030578 [Daphnia magna]|uniref:Uncharacterized protein n=1 Tax=Daphnia magna TaxID=35525 RepID=A0ABQ9ZRQ4_9CRUS|nr:hypothetical protein OUZ56_030578 [Daphnia magna]